MKKFILTVIFLSIPVIVLAQNKYKTLPNSYFSGTLTNTATDKYPIDTVLIDFTAYSNYLNADTCLIYFEVDTVAGKYGGNASDSLGRNAVRLRYQPAIRIPPLLESYKSALWNDTLLNVPAVSLTDSVPNINSINIYKFQIEYPMYRLYIDHFYGDTSKVNPQARSSYKGFVGLRK